VSELFWFHELLASGKGPDWVFNATFAPGSGGALAASVRASAPPGFTYYRATQRPCSIHYHTKSCDYDLYVDTPHYQACVDQLEGRHRQNMYVYHSIQVCRDEFQIVRGYGPGILWVSLAGCVGATLVVARRTLPRAESALGILLRFQRAQHPVGLERDP
jgi:hypothetical protein